MSSEPSDLDRLEDVLGASTDELLLDRLFTAAPVGLGFLDSDLRYVRVNETLAEMNGRSVADHLGRRPSQVLPDFGEQVEAVLQQVMRDGEPVRDMEFADPRGDRHYLVSFSPLQERGEILGVLGVILEITDRKRAEMGLATALDHSHRLQRVSASLAAALTVDEVAGVVVRSSMEAVGGNCGVFGVRADAKRIVVGHRFGMAGRPPSELDVGADLPMPEAMRQRKPLVVPSRQAWAVRYPHTPPRGEFEGFVAVPLVFEGRATGVMGIGLSEARTPDEQELSLLSAIGRQGAQALERAQLFEERTFVASTLQKGLLPTRLPEIPGLDVAVSYRSIGDGVQVGGDFYDVVDLDGGRWLAAVGDVCGKGAAAAVLSGLVRTTISAVAERGDRPVDILSLANRAIRRHAGVREDYATAVCAVAEPTPQGVAIALSSGGHPPALVLRADGRLEVVDCAGLMLGVTDYLALEEVLIDLVPGDALILYTDGITEARTDSGLFGEERLIEAIHGAAGGDAAAIAQAVDRAVRAFQAGPPRDDAAVLVLRAV